MSRAAVGVARGGAGVAKGCLGRGGVGVSRGDQVLQCTAESL